MSIAISAVDRTPGLLRIHATIATYPFEFVSYQAGDFEVYDRPARWGGVPRFVGYMPPETSAKLRRLAREWQAEQPGAGPTYLALVAQGVMP